MSPLSSTRSSSEASLQLWKEYDPLTLVVASVSAGAILSYGLIRLNRRFLRRIPTSAHVTPSMLARKQWISGVVTSVGDADNFRLYHTPLAGIFYRLGIQKLPTTRTDLTKNTIHIRLAGIDAPEGGHFGGEAQPYYPEALAWLKKEIEGKRVKCQLLSRDHYGRIVAVPMRRTWRHPLTGRSVSFAMLQAGWAVVYEKSGAEYGKWGKDKYVKIQNRAQAAKRGMWASSERLESPGEYKKRLAAERAQKDAKPSGRTSARLPQPSRSHGWFQWPWK